MLSTSRPSFDGRAEGNGAWGPPSPFQSPLFTQTPAQRKRLLAQKNFQKYMDYFFDSSYIRKLCLSFEIPEEIYDPAVREFKEAVANNQLNYLTSTDVRSHMEENSNMERVFLPAFYEYLVSKYPDDTRTLSKLLVLTDLSRPWNWYPNARRIRRKIILHIGPPDSRQSEAALARLRESSRALYCGSSPLKVRAVYASLGPSASCALITGEEPEETVGFDACAALAELVPLDRRFDVAVVDDVDMISDRERGWAWSRAIL
ncbi:hypothetical protein BDK51DRAFT_29198, partial [Blyttiomyces helicus]